MEPTEEIRVLARSLKQKLDNLRTWGVREIPRRLPSASRDTALSRLEKEVMACTRCSLHRTRMHHVFGEGSPCARLVFVGEAPGHEEDLTGRPFVGAAGMLLTKMIEAIGLSRRDVYICNVLKDRPPQNRTPRPEEVEACRPFLLRQLGVIQPKIICALGAVAAQALLGTNVSITRIRGRLNAFQPACDAQGAGDRGARGRPFPVIATFHPAYLLRNPSAKRMAWHDLKRVKALLEVGDR